MAGQIFNGNINGMATAWMMIYMLMFAVAWEAWCNWLSKRCEDNKAHTELLEKIAKELMILGFIAFMVLLMKELSILPWNGYTLHAFEFCDLLVSICVLIYVANCWISSMTMSMTQREWDRLAMMPTTTVMTRVDSYMAGVASGGLKKIAHKVPFMASQWRHEADFKILQLLFSMKFHMPAHFDYVQYINMVLQGVVVSMANITTLHWVLIMAINGVWFVLIKLMSTDPFEDKPFTPDDHICLFDKYCGTRRRQLGGGGDDACSGLATCESTVTTDSFNEGDYNACAAVSELDDSTACEAYQLGGVLDAGSACTYTPAEVKDVTVDIGAYATRSWMWVYIALGWFVVMLLWLILQNIDKRMRRVLDFNGAPSEQEMSKLLEETQRELLAHESHLSEHELFKTSAPADEIDEKDNHTVAAKPRKHLIELGETFEDGDADQVMVFKNGKDSNDVLSIGKFELLVFTTQFLQLVIDFYLGFYVVHMRLRVSKAHGHESIGGGDLVSQLLFHIAMLLPVFISFYLIMLVTRNVALLIGVLHLNENAVSAVLAHMELVKSIRRRIQDVLGKTKVVHANPNATVASELLKKAQDGEVALLKLLSSKSGRIASSEIAGMIGDHASLRLTVADTAAFMDREAYHHYQLLDPAHQQTLQTSHTLNIAEGEGVEKDSIEVAEFVEFVLRSVADILHDVLAHSPDDPEANVLALSVASLDCVSTEMMTRCTELTRTKALFRHTDKDNSGSVSRTELFQALRRFKVSVTKKEYKEVFRVRFYDKINIPTMIFVSWH